MVRRALVALTLSGAAVAGCSDDDTTVLTPDEDTAEVSVGGEVVIEVPENPSVGDNWQVDTAPDSAVARIVDDEFESDDPSGTRDGAGGVQRFTVEAIGEGETTIVLHNCYRCDADGNTPPDEEEFAVDETFVISVRS